MKITKFQILILICIILLGSGCFFVVMKNNQHDSFEDILSRYSEENIAGSLMADLTHDGNDELLVISQKAISPDATSPEVMETTLEIYAMMDGNPVVIYKDLAADNHPGYRWYYLTVVDHKNYILQYTPEIWNGIGNFHFEVFSFNQEGQKEILEKQEVPYDSIHTSEDDMQDLSIKMENFKTIYEKWKANSIPLITIGSDMLTGDNDYYVLEEKVILNK